MPGEQVFTNCTNQGPIFVHVKDSRITRVRPIVFDETDAPSWTINVNGQKFTPPRKATVSPAVLTERPRVYSEDRIQLPYMNQGHFEPFSLNSKQRHD